MHTESRAAMDSLHYSIAITQCQHLLTDRRALYSIEDSWLESRFILNCIPGHISVADIFEI